MLTPVTLWQDFDDSLPANEELLFERREGGIVWQDLYFYGRNVGSGAGRVKIYGRYVFPENAGQFPVVLIMFEARMPFDEALILRYVGSGYGVLCVDYCGEKAEGYCTVYPKLVDYGNYDRAERRIDFCDRSAKETSWYEWAAVARYAVNFLKRRPEVRAVGALGLKTGGEILYKIAPYCPIACLITVCAGGWLAYRGMGKSANEMHALDDERHRFIAGIDSQSYAPHVKCPVLLISAISDKKYHYERVYDTFRQINPNVEKAILFSAHGSGQVGGHSLKDIDLFLDKYLRGRSVFLSRQISLSVEEDSEGDLVATGNFDPDGEIKDFGIFFTENVAAYKTRDWTRLIGKPSELLPGNVGKIPLPLYKGTEKALVFAFANYSNDFSVTSRILEVNITKRYKNACPKSRVIYSEADGRNGFSTFWKRTRSIGGCFSESTNSGIRIQPGYGGIKGISARPGVITYRVGEARYEAPEGASFRFDAYAPNKSRLRVVFYRDEEARVGFLCDVEIEGGGTWKHICLESSDFKAESGETFQDFGGVVSAVFMSDDDVLINNVFWI